ncbi:hypothetical protein KJ764_01395 [Patescibacteria group bacterium]|nr:hypothetical protein [Patescibacteria group bacterium]
MKQQILKILEQQQTKMEEMVEDFKKIIDQLKKDTFKKAEADESVQEDKAAEDLLKEL